MNKAVIEIAKRKIDMKLFSTMPKTTCLNICIPISMDDFISMWDREECSTNFKSAISHKGLAEYVGYYVDLDIPVDHGRNESLSLCRNEVGIYFKANMRNVPRDVRVGELTREDHEKNGVEVFYVKSLRDFSLEEFEDFEKLLNSI